jgi:uncharacterized protein (DUF488 family)
MKTQKIIWTIGHSTRTEEEFIDMLQAFNISQLIDVRQFPGSRKFPQFNKEILEITLKKHQIHYIHLLSLGGRRKVNPDSKNTAWRHPAFRGYADYMETENFKEGLKELEDLACKVPTAIMCSEAVWWRCHRSMISDALKVEGWEVLHIMAINKEAEHSYTEPAKIVNGELTYQDNN